MPRLDLLELASELLVQAAEILESEEPGAPERQVITIGPPALDCCDQLAVSAIDVRFAQLGDQAEVARGQACHRMTLTGLRVTITGCVPTLSDKGKAPSVASILASSADLYAQAWTLWCGLLYRARNGPLWEEAGWPDRVVLIGPVVPLGEQGGCAGWTVDTAVQLNPDASLGAEGS